ncbi:MAG: hypothetical protein K5769_11190 [Pseudobutyrivibrio sp.]|nr:hypothetical protein [Pseudobutyrivibrio sp.]
MLGKLIKYDFKNTRATMAILCLIAILMGISFRIICSCNKSIDADSLISLVLIGATIISVMAIKYMFKYYDKSLYSTEGYFTFTLPATIKQVVSSKIIVSCIWAILFTLSLVFCIVICNEETTTTLSASLSAKNIGLGIYMIITLLLEIISVLMAFFFSKSISQLWSKRKRLGNILCFLGTGLLLYTVYSINKAASYSIRGAHDGYWEWTDLFCIGNFICAVIFTVLLYIGAISVANKNLNLD